MKSSTPCLTKCVSWYFCTPQSYHIIRYQIILCSCALSRYTEAQCHFSGVLNDITYNTTFSNDLPNIYINFPHIERFLTDCRKTRTKVITVKSQKR